MYCVFFPMTHVHDALHLKENATYAFPIVNEFFMYDTSYSNVTVVPGLDNLFPEHVVHLVLQSLLFE